MGVGDDVGVGLGVWGTGGTSWGVGKAGQGQGEGWSRRGVEAKNP